MYNTSTQSLCYPGWLGEETGNEYLQRKERFMVGAPAAKKKYDVAIIGSGIGGATLSAILARNGLDVLVLEAGTHPKFAIGESMILETSESMRALAEMYDVPELAYFSSENYLNYAGNTHGVKRHFGFVHHIEGEPIDIHRVLQAVIPGQPYGHELHLYRQDTDSLLTSAAVSYGASVVQNTLVIDVKVDTGQVTLTTSRGVEYTADYLVDAGGFRSFVAEQNNLRHSDLRTQTRGMFTHMIDVPCIHEVSASREEYGIPFRMSEGTLHHIFEGGWLWAIPFNNHEDAVNPLCSVGLLLDPRVFPPRPYLDPEEEFYDIIGRYPGISSQFKNAKAVRPWVRSTRLQYSSHHAVGDRYALLGHAVGFVDPLFSKGLYSTHMAIMVLADLLLSAKETGDYSSAAFSPLETTSLNFMEMNDRLIAGSFKSWGNYELWRVYSVVWLLGAYLEYLKLSISRMRARNRSEYLDLVRGNRLVGGGFVPFFALAEKIDHLFERVDPKDREQVDRVVAESKEVFASFPWLPLPFQEILDGKTFLAKRKFRWALLSRSKGFMGSGEYRRHFFGDMSYPELIIKVAADRYRYSRRGVKKQRRTNARLAW